MARKKTTKRPKKRPGKRVGEPTVWVELGPLWLERRATKGGELIVTERQRRRIKPGPRRKTAPKKK